MTRTPPIHDGSSSRVRAAWLAAAVLAVVGTPLVLLARGGSLVWRDTAALFEPQRVFITEALHHGHLPLWTPFEGLGMPFFGQLIHGVLHPVTLALAFLAPHAGLDPAIVVYLGLGALGAAVAARSLGASPAAAALAGIAYGASGWLYGMSSIIQLLASAASAPWVLAAMRHGGRGGRGGAACTALALAMLHFAGDPEWTIVAVALGGILALDAGGWPGLGRATVGVAMGTAVAAIQLVPAWAFLQQSVRSQGVPGAGREQWALAPWRLFELAVPGFLSGPLGNVHWPLFQQLGGATVHGTGMPLAPSVFVGAATLMLAGRGLNESRASRLLGAAGLVLVWLALGPALGADAVGRHIPISGSFRYAEKLVGPVTLCIALLAALGADRFAAAPSRRLAWTSVVIATVCLVAFVFRHMPGLVHAAIVLFMLAGLTWVGIRRARWRRFLVPSLVALVLAQSIAARPYTLLSIRPGVRETAPLKGIVDPPARIGTPLDKGRYAVSDERPEAESLIALQSHFAEPPYNVSAGLEQVGISIGLWPTRFSNTVDALRAALGDGIWVALRRFALTHVIIKTPADEAERKRASTAATEAAFKYHDDQWGFDVWEVPHRSWATFATKAVSAATPAEATARLVKEMNGGAGAVVVEGEVPATLGHGEVLSTDRLPEHTRVTARSDEGGLLVINDAWWPGWQAELDGAPVSILPADGLVRAVAWPAGTHTLELRYEPPELGLGIALSSLGVLALLLLVGAEVRRARRRSLVRKPAKVSKPVASPTPDTVTAEPTRPAAFAGLLAGWRSLAGFGNESLILPRWVFIRCLGIAFIFAFAGLCAEGQALFGPQGVEPVGDRLATIATVDGPVRYLLYPSVFWLSSSAAMVSVVAWSGLAAAIALTLNVWPRATIALCWLLFCSFIAPSADFSPTIVDRLLLETALVAIPFAPAGLWPGLGRDRPPNAWATLFIRFLVVRIPFEAGFGKFFMSGGQWRSLDYMSHMRVITPFPTYLAFIDHAMPRTWHSLETAFTGLAELGAAILVLAGRRARIVGACLFVGLQLAIWATSDFGWLNFLTIALCVLLLDDSLITRVLRLPERLVVPDALAPSRREGWPWPNALWTPIWTLNGGTAAVLLGLLILNRGVPGPGDRLGLALHDLPFKPASAYTPFTAVAADRQMLEVEGSNDGGVTWRPYEFRYAPQMETRMSPWIAPYFARFDAAFYTYALDWQRGMFRALANRLLQGDRQVISLFRSDPFPQGPPNAIRFSLMRMTLNDWATYKATGHFWEREHIGESDPLTLVAR